MKYDKNIIFRIDEKTKKQLEEYCIKYNIKISDLIRKAVIKQIENEFI